MTEQQSTTRTVISLSTGARVGMTVCLLMLVGAAYLLWSPIQLYPPEGFPIKCGSGATPPSDNLGATACGSVNVIRQWQAGCLAIAGVLTALGSVYAFGIQRRDEQLIGNSQQPRHEGNTTISD